MSLKAVHVLFIALSTLLALGVGAWAAAAWSWDHAAGYLMLAVISFAGGGGLAVYGVRFLRKCRDAGIE